MFYTFNLHFHTYAGIIVYEQMNFISNTHALHWSFLGHLIFFYDLRYIMHIGYEQFFFVVSSKQLCISAIVVHLAIGTLWLGSCFACYLDCEACIKNLKWSRPWKRKWYLKKSLFGLRITTFSSSMGNQQMERYFFGLNFCITFVVFVASVF